MKKFCTSCGANGEVADVVCTECGTPFAKQENSAVQSVTPAPVQRTQQPPMSKKKKALFSSVALLLILCIGSYLVGKNYASPENTVKRFQEAVFDKDKTGIQKVTQFIGGDQLTSGDIDAVIKFGEKDKNAFARSIGAWDDFEDTFLFSLKKEGKAFGIFDGYKIIVAEQYLSVSMPYMDLDYKLNGETVPMVEDGWRFVLGPVAPGIYNLSVDLEGEYVTYSDSMEVRLLDWYSDPVYEDFYIDLDYVTVALVDTTAVDTQKSHLLIGDEKIPFDEYGEINGIGPLVLDGSVKAKVVSVFPWGTYESDAYELDSTYQYVHVNGLDKNLEKIVLDTILAYGEEVVATRSLGDAAGMKTVTDRWKEAMQDDYESNAYYGNYYTGYFDELQVDFDNAYLDRSDKDEFEVIVTGSFLYQGDYHSAYEEPSLSDDLYSCNLIVTNQNGEWKIDQCYVGWYPTEAGGTTVAGSKKLYKADVVVEVTDESDEEDEEEDI